jgi:hypothetical protein
LKVQVDLKNRNPGALAFNRTISLQEISMYRNEALMVWPNPSMTRWLVNDRRATTGDLRRIPIQQIVIHGLKIGGASFGWQWWQRDKVTGSISARVHVDEGKATLVLSYVLNGVSVTQFIRLDTELA